MITEPHVNIHNGTYLCVFTDNSGKKVSKLVIILDVERKVEGVIQLEVHFSNLHAVLVTDDVTLHISLLLTNYSQGINIKSMDSSSSSKSKMFLIYIIIEIFLHKVVVY